MNENKTTVPSVALRYGLITGFITVIYSLILFLANQNTNSYLGWISYIILIGGIVLAYKEFKRENEFMSYGQGLGIGTLIGAVTGLLSGIFLYVYVQFVDTGFLDKIRETQIIEMEKRNLSDEQIEQALAMSANFTGPGMMLVMAVLGSIVLAFLCSLVIAAIMRNSRPEFE